MTESTRASKRTRVPAAYRKAAENAPRGIQGGVFVADVAADHAVVFVIGMRINRWRRVRSWMPVFVAMPKMLRELQDRPGSGLLGARTYWSGRVFLVVQYWASVEALGRYARDAGQSHQPAWVAFNRAAAGSGDVGIFHETYEVPRAGVESLYGNMPEFGLAAAHASIPRARTRRSRAQDHMGQRDPEYVEAS
ncbi:MAG TPA: DUF4188 domain-containing protein [Nocardioidaceae bacterium]